MRLYYHKGKNIYQDHKQLLFKENLFTDSRRIYFFFKDTYSITIQV